MKTIINFSVKKLMTVLGVSVLTLATFMPLPASAQVTFRNVVTGDVIDFSFGKKGEETEAVVHFKNTAENLYQLDDEAIKVGEDYFMTACSGCHGHHLEGKLGPALGDDYWTYRGGLTDKGLFEIIYDGARAMMGPQRNQLTIDEMLKVMAFIRASYWGPIETTPWLTDEQRERFTPAVMPEEFKDALEEFNKRNAGN